MSNLSTNSRRVTFNYRITFEQIILALYGEKNALVF